MLTSVAEEVVKKVVLVLKNIRSGDKAQTYFRRLPSTAEEAAEKVRTADPSRLKPARDDKE